MEAFADTIGLRALGFGARVIDVLNREIKLELVPLRIAAVLAAAVWGDKQSSANLRTRDQDGEPLPAKWPPRIDAPANDGP